MRGATDMNVHDEPLVGILTPVYNGAEYLAECIESVLSQTYRNFEYTIVNNCSTDASLEIAQSYARRDSRVRVQSNASFVGLIENHNIAFRTLSPQARYCKVVSADDTIFPDCLSRLVETAMANPSAGFVGCYQISGNSVRWQGFPYPRTLLSGREAGRQMLLGRDRLMGFGTPTSLLYRADLVRTGDTFYPNASPHADTSVCYERLRECDFAFVYRVLCWERVSAGQQSAKAAKLNEDLPATLNDIVKYGRYYLDEMEYRKKYTEELELYYQALAVNLAAFRGKDYLEYHKRRLQELGGRLEMTTLLKHGAVKLLREIVNPRQALAKARRRLGAQAARPEA